MSATSIASAAWALLGNLAVQSLFVVLVALLIERRIQSVFWRRALWQGSVIALALIVVVEFSGLGRQWMSLPDRPAMPSQTIQHANAGEPVRRNLSDEFRQQIAQRRLAASGRSHGSISPEPQSQEQDNRTSNSASAMTNRREQTLSTGFSAIHVIAAVWMLGSFAVLLRLCLARSVLSLFRWRVRTLTDETLHAQVNALAPRIGCRRRIHLCESDRLSAPIAFGVARPTIVVPSRFREQFSAGEQQAILAHELAHLAANDPGWRMGIEVVAAVLWWQPLVWWARLKWEESAEAAADEASLLIGNGPGALAESLLKLGSRLASPRAFGWLGIEGSGFRSALGRRVERLMRIGSRPWAPPKRMRIQIARAVGSIVIAGVALIGAAWSSPETFKKGESMKTLTQTWKQSLATLAFAAVTSMDAAPVTAAPPAEGNNQPTQIVQPAESKASPYKMDPALMRRYGLMPPAQSNPPPGMDPELMRRYGMVPTGPQPSNQQPPPAGEAAQEIQSKLEQIVIEEVQYDGLPLGEILRDLQQESKRRDPQKRGVNFLISNKPEPSSEIAGPMDPLTGQPLPPEPMDISNTIVRFNLPLYQVRMKDLLNAIVRVADQPIRYSVEEYGVVFSPSASAGFAFAPMAVPEQIAPLQVRTFRVDTNSFFAGLESAFGFKMDEELRTGDRSQRSRWVQNVLGDLLSQLGISITSPQKWIFYNDVTGILMVRGSDEDLAIVQAAIETLGGSSIDRFGGAGAGYGGDPLGAFGIPPRYTVTPRGHPTIPQEDESQKP